MTTRRSRRRWCACLLISVAGASAKFSFIQTRITHQWHPNEKPPCLFFRGGAQSAPHRQPPPPPPPRQYYSNHGDQQQTVKQANEERKTWIPPPPRRPVNRDPVHQQIADTQDASAPLSRPDGNVHTMPSRPLQPPPPNRSFHTVPQRPPLPLPPPVSSLANRRQEPRMETKSDSPDVDEKSPFNHNNRKAMPQSLPSYSAANELSSGDTLSFADDASTPASNSRAPDISNDVVFLVPPKDELNRISLQTALSARPKKEHVFEKLIQLRQNMALEQLLLSQQSAKEQMAAITGLLQVLLAQQQNSDSLVVYSPRTVTGIPPKRVRRRRVEKVRKIPRQTILSSLQELDRDLSDGEFETLIEGLRDPSEVEEIYHEYEYDEEEVHSQASSMTPNAEEMNAFLRESSESESLYPPLTANSFYDSDVYYGDYYDMEPIEDELLAAWSVSDYSAVTSDEESHRNRVEESVDAVKATTSCEGHENADCDTTVSTFADDATSASFDSEIGRRYSEGRQNVNAPTEATTPRDTSPLQQQPPPPPRRPATSQNVKKLHVAGRMESRESTRWASEGLRQPPPPPPRRPVEQPRPSIRIRPEISTDIEPELGESEDFDEVELQLLEETAIDEGLGITDDEENDNVGDYDDDIDENDLRILQLSQWNSFIGKKKRNIVDMDDVVVADDVLLDHASDDDIITTDDFTDFDFATENESPLLVTPLGVITEESSEDEMHLGESAVTHAVPTLGHLPPPPPPRPPPRHPIEGPDGPNIATQYSAQAHQFPPPPSTVYTSNPVGAHTNHRPDEYEYQRPNY